MRGLRRHAEGGDVVFLAVQLETHGVVALMALKGWQPMRAYRSRARMAVEVSDPPHASPVCGSAVLCGLFFSVNNLRLFAICFWASTSNNGCRLRQQLAVNAAFGLPSCARPSRPLRKRTLGVWILTFGPFSRPFCSLLLPLKSPPGWGTPCVPGRFHSKSLKLFSQRDHRHIVCLPLFSSSSSTE